MKTLPHTRHCFVCGLHNPAGLRLDFVTDHKTVETRFQFRRELCGFVKTVHGGLIATVLDEVMVWAVGVNAGQLTYCAEMSVRYQRPTSPESEVIARGELVENKRGRLFVARGELLDAQGQLLAESTGKYLPLPPDLVPQMKADFLESPDWVFKGPGQPAGTEKTEIPAP